VSDHKTQLLRREANESGDWTPYVHHLEQQLGIGTLEPGEVTLDARPITEEDGEQKKWYKMARDIESVDAFIKKLSAYDHDYGTVCHAISAAAVAASWRMAKDHGITGFQAGAVMWGYIQNWKGMHGALRLVDFKNMLYPQYHDEFQQTMPPETWDWRQKEAQKQLSKHGADSYAGGHAQEIVNGKVPFGWTVIGD